MPTYKGDYRDLAYDRKGTALQRLCEILGDGLGMTWGWKKDPLESYAPWVLYVELPQGQISFHSRHRMSGPDFEGEWDREHESESRIIAYCDSVLAPAHQTH